MTVARPLRFSAVCRRVPRLAALQAAIAGVCPAEPCTPIRRSFGTVGSFCLSDPCGPRRGVPTFRRGTRCVGSPASILGTTIAPSVSFQWSRCGIILNTLGRKLSALRPGAVASRSVAAEGGLRRMASIFKRLASRILHSSHIVRRDAERPAENARGTPAQRLLMSAPRAGERRPGRGSRMSFLADTPPTGRVPAAHS
jgi:hypothetical protein